MHNIKILLPVLAVIILLSCEKDEYYWGTVTAQKNGVPWPGKIRAIQSHFAESKFEVYINTLDMDEYPLETLGFFKIPLKVGRYYLSYGFNQPPDDSITGCFYTNGYRDQLYDSYLLSQQDSTSYLEITEYDNKKKEIKGRFNLIVWPDIKGSWNAPDSIVFSGGEFHTRIED
jgi:hypothetical protein